MFSFEGEIRKYTKYGKAIFPCFRASRLVSEVGNVEKVKSASNSVDAIMNFKLHRIEAYIETPEVTIRKVKIFGFMPMWTSLRFYVVYFTYFGVCFFDFLTTKLNTRESRCSKTTKYCLSLFSLFYPILRFGGPKTINPSPLSS